MRILYLSCHAINEYEDVLLFTELGHQVLSQGAYKEPSDPEEKSRPPITGAYYNKELRPLLHIPMATAIPKPLIDWCDLVYILGIEGWLPINWDNIKHKHVVFRSIGQSVENTEGVLSRYRRQGLHIVRYSPIERGIPGYVGEDAFIRFYKDSSEYKDWNGQVKEVITVAQSMKYRGQFLKFDIFEKCTRGFPRKLYGHANDDAGELWGGSLSYEDLKKAYRNNRVFFYTCTKPAPYTMGFMEAWMTGTPVVAIGSALAGYSLETPHFIENGVNGFVSDSLLELRKYVSMLLEDHDLAKKISSEGRKSAIELFGKEKVKDGWKHFFEGLS